MTPKSFAVVACRLLAVWFFVLAAQSLYGAIINLLPLGRTGWSRIGSSSALQSVLYLGGFPLTLVCASFVLWLGASIFAEYMTRGVESKVSNRVEGGIVSWQAVGFSLIGMIALVQGFSNLVGGLGYAVVLFSGKAGTVFHDIVAKLWLQSAVAVVQSLLGLALLLWAQKTIRVLDYLQRGGRDEASND